MSTWFRTTPATLPWTGLTLPAGAVRRWACDASLTPVLARLVDGAWQPAQNLGPNVNTRGFETAPFLSADGRTLYEIGSITKTFTATLLADAVERPEEIDADLALLADRTDSVRTYTVDETLAEIPDQVFETTTVPSAPETTAPTPTGW